MNRYESVTCNTIINLIVQYTDYKVYIMITAHALYYIIGIYNIVVTDLYYTRNLQTKEELRFFISDNLIY